MSRLPLLLVATLALSTVGCGVQVDATVTGPVGFSTDKVHVKVVGPGPADLTCSDGACEPMRLPSNGKTTIDVKVPPGPAKVVTITIKQGIRSGSATLDLAAGAAGSTLNVEKGVIICLPTGCRGRIDIAPASKISLEAPAGTTIEVGGEKFTVPASGALDSPLKLAISTPIDKQPLDKICTGRATSSTVFTSTTLTLTFPGKSPMTARADLDMALAQQGLSLALVGVRKGAVVFPWEKPGDAAKGKRAAVYTDGAYCYEAGTTGATVADLDVIVVSDVDTREDQCVYILRDGGKVASALTLTDRKATVYDRITGRTLATRMFNAPKRCASEITVRGSSTSTSRQYSAVDHDVIVTWASTFAK